MPEGDTIRRLADRIQQRFAGQQCVRCVMRDPRLSGVDFTGCVLLSAEAVGKHLLLRFDNGETLHSHLKMAGSWTVGPAATEPEWRRRVELWMQNGRLSAIDMPILTRIRTTDEADVVGYLGPDLCTAQAPDVDEIVGRLQREPAVPLVGALLDQRNVAGFGNVYVVELPFIVGVSPYQPVGTISDLASAVGIGAALIRCNAGRSQRNTTGRKLNTADHWIYGKRAKSCPLCGARLDSCSDALSPWRRASTWCPACQPLVDERAVDLRRAREMLGLHPARRELAFPR